MWHLSNIHIAFMELVTTMKVLDLSDVKDSTTPSTEEVPMDRHTGDATTEHVLEVF